MRAQTDGVTACTRVAAAAEGRLSSRISNRDSATFDSRTSRRKSSVRLLSKGERVRFGDTGRRGSASDNLTTDQTTLLSKLSKVTGDVAEAGLALGLEAI